MRKIERHRLNLRRFGERHCPRQTEVLPGDERFSTLVCEEVARAGCVGIRTDWLPGHEHPGAELGLLPFRTEMRSWMAVMDFVTPEMRRNLAVLVCEAVPAQDVALHFVAFAADEDTVYVEWSAAAASQRAMYGDRGRLRELCVGEASFAVVHGRVLRCFRPHEVRRWQFDRVWQFALEFPREELTGTVTRSGRLLFW